jgi:transcriptional regulator with XRE-family HTH domain
LKTELNMPVGDRLKQLRTEADMTQQALATAAGLSISVVTQIERGVNADPRLSTLKALAKALGCTMNELTGNDDEPLVRSRKPKGRKA